MHTTFFLFALIIGWTPFLLLHPFPRAYLPALLAPYLKKARMLMSRIVDDDRLEHRHWRSELRELELWENKRYSEKDKGFSKASLRPGERKAWTREKDGEGATKVRMVLDVSDTSHPELVYMDDILGEEGIKDRT